MVFKKVTAIVDELQQQAIQQALESHGVKGYSVHPLKGRGHYANTFKADLLVSHVEISIYTSHKHVEKIANLIIQTADVGADSEGLIAISPVDELYWIYEGKPVTEDKFHYFEVDHD